MNTTELSPRPCPQCGAPNNMATGVGHDRPPKPGDVSLCCGCGAILMFNNDLSSRKVTPDEEVEILLSMTAEFRTKFLTAQALIKAKDEADDHDDAHDRA